MPPDPTLFETLSAGIWLLDRQLRTTYANARMASMLSCDLAELQGRTILSFVPAESRDEVRDYLMRCAEEAAPPADITFLRSNAPTLLASVSAGPTAGNALSPAALACVVVDVTERRRTEEALRRSAAYYRALTAAAPDHIFVINDHDRIEYVNQAAAEQMRTSPEQIIGRLRTEMFPPDVAERQGANLRKVIHEGKPLYVEGRTLYREREVWLSTWLAPIPDESGNVTAVLGLSRDFSARKRVEDDLRAAEQRLRVVMSHLPLVVWATDRSGAVTFCGGQALPSIGATVEECVGRNFSDADAPPFSALADHVRRALAGESYSSRIDVQDLTFEAWSAPLRDDTQQITGATGVIADITERRRLETELSNAQKMEAIGRLAGGIAHDFNNNLTGIIGYVDMILSQIGNDKPISNDLREVQRAAERAAGLVKRLLAFGRRQVVQPRTLDINAAVDGLRPMLERLIAEHIQVIVRLAPDLWPVMGDVGQLEQVIMNLALNARDAMPSGGTLTIETSNVSDTKQLPASAAGPHVMLAIRDIGGGMDAATKAHLFEPFFTTKPLGHGTGLGLSTVYGIVKQLGGSIWVESEVGRGSTFRIFMPVAAQVPEPATATKRAGPAVVGSETILLVEDEDSVRRFTRLLLERHGFRVVEAASPDQALSMAADFDGSIALLLTDVVMPHLSGPELAEKLRASRPDLQVLYMSGYPAGMVMQGSTIDPSVRLIQKPFTMADLLKHINEALKGSP